MPIELDLYPDDTVGRNHALLYRKLSAWYIEDLGSRRGTRVNGEFINKPIALQSTDKITIGTTSLLLAFDDDEIVPLSTSSALKVDEIVAPVGISPNEEMRIMAQVSQIINAEGATWNDTMRALVQAVRDHFPQADRCTLILIEGERRELVPRAFSPRDRAAYSRTLARQAVETEEAAIHTFEANRTTLYNATAALYVPLMWNGSPAGVFHVDSTRPVAVFTQADLSWLTQFGLLAINAIRRTEFKDIPILPTIMISYSHDDKPFVKRIVPELERRQIRVWFDEKIEHGTLWENVIATAIKNATAVVYIASEMAVNSKFVNGKWLWHKSQSARSCRSCTRNVSDPPRYSTSNSRTLRGLRTNSNFNKNWTNWRIASTRFRGANTNGR